MIRVKKHFFISESPVLLVKSSYYSTGLNDENTVPTRYSTFFQIDPTLLKIIVQSIPCAMWLLICNHNTKMEERNQNKDSGLK